jgi:hypothetical protein
MTDFRDWTADDQRRVDTFTRDTLAVIYAANDPHTLFVALHGFLQAAAHGIAHDLEQRPELARYYLAACDRLREHVALAAVPTALTEH